MNSLVYINNLNFGCNSKSFPANFMIFFFPLTIKLRAIIGIKIASIFSPMFSINAEYPFSMDYSKSLFIFLEPNLRHFKLLSFSFSLIQVIPYSCGSIIKEYLSELVNIVPFSTDTASEGKNCLFHMATFESSVRILTGSGFPEVGILFFVKKSKNY